MTTVVAVAAAIASWNSLLFLGAGMASVCVAMGLGVPNVEPNRSGQTSSRLRAVVEFIGGTAGLAHATRILAMSLS